MSRVVIEKLVPGGEGFGRLQDGMPVFVPGALPGDVVSLEKVLRKKQFARAETWRLETPSASRRAPPCPVFERCGGCDWMALPESEQRARKLALLAEALRRTGRFREPLPLTLHESSTDLGYRQRVRLHFDERGNLGYFGRRSHEVVSASSCRVTAPELGRAVAELEAAVRAEPARFAAFAEVEVRALGEQRSLAFLPRRGASAPDEPLNELRQRFLVRVLGAAAQPESAAAPLESGEPAAPSLERWPSVAGVYLLAAPGAFTQVNWGVNRALVEELLAGAARRGVESFVDLYCGVGNFTLPLLASGLVGQGVEDDAAAIASARCAARAQALPEGGFSCQDVARWVAAAEEPRDLVVVDPPRAGIHADPARIVRLCRRALFLCSCDPVTFARDLRRLVDGGLRIASIVAYDMFPQTHHFEVVAWLDAG